jgi:seryl-tRNA synthetase
VSEREELQKRLEAIAAVQAQTDAELASQEAREREANATLLAAVKSLREEVENAELELFGLEEQLKELRAAVRRAR